MLFETILNGILFGSTYSLVAIGFTLIFGVIHRLNVAHGATIMVTAYAGATVTIVFGSGSYPILLLAFATSVLTGMVLGWMVEFIAFRPLSRASYLTPFVTSSAIAIIIEEVFVKLSRKVPIFQPDFTPFPSPLDDLSLSFGGIFIRGTYVITFVVSLILVAILARWVSKSPAGRAMRAVEENATVAALLGVNVRRTEVTAFVVASALAGASGCLIGASVGSIGPFMGTHLVLISFVVIVIGGLGNIVGAMLGGLLVGVLEALVARYWSPTYAETVLFITLFLVLLVRPHGLFSRATAAKD